MSAIVYETCCQAWRGEELGGGVTTLQFPDGTIIGRFPLGFLRNGGSHVNCKLYLQSAAMLMTSLPEGATVSLIHEIYSDDTDDSAIRAGAYTFLSSECPKLASGPQGKSRSRGYQDADDSTTISRSSRSSANQSRFRLHVLFRDGRCLATQNQDPSSVTAAHIVPFSLGQEYLDSITHIPGIVGLFSVSNGLTLRKDLHTKFDSYEWGIYVSHGEHIIHVFGDSNHEMHGLVIDYGRSKMSQLPNSELLMWHYKQCLLARIRGFYVPSI